MKAKAMAMIRIPSDPRIFLIDWGGNFLALCGLCIPIYLLVRQAGRGWIGGALSFWLCMTAAVFLYEFAGEDMDLAPGAYLIGGWLIGLMYCLPILILVEIWRALRPNPYGYCKKCGRSIKVDQARCPVGHSSEDLSRGFEVIQCKGPYEHVQKDSKRMGENQI
jgi:hypothetical protein